MDAFDFIDLERAAAAALDAFTALVWFTLAQSSWRARGTARPRGTLPRLTRLACLLMTVHFEAHVVLDLVPFDPHPTPDPLHVILCSIAHATAVAVLPVLRHLVPLGTIGDRAPGRLWLTVNYGSAVAAFALSWSCALGATAGTMVFQAYLLGMSLLILWEAGHRVRRRWRPVFIADLGERGFVVLALALLVGVLLTTYNETATPSHNLAASTSRSFLALSLAAPFVLRILGEVGRNFLVKAIKITAAAAIYVGAYGLAVAQSDSRMVLLIHGTALLLLVFFVGLGGQWLRNTVDCLLLRRSHLWDQRLHDFVQTLKPELGVAECCRRSVDEIVAGLFVRGAGIVLEPGGERFSQGRLGLERIAGLWPDSAELPESAFDLLWLDDVKLQEELYEEAVTWIVPIVSPQRRWGHLFVAAGAIGTAASDAKLETLEHFAHQLALVLDTTDLLSRAVGVERDLAQAEKLAALGETAARIAHEIRNPVTAARSLSQLMAREPDSPLNVEHAQLVTRELDRVERQVKALLQFARGEESYHFEAVRLGELVGATVEDLEPCYPVEELEIETRLDADVRVRADPERLRQVVVNLVTNAVDALGESPPPRRLTVTVGASNGDATLTVEDSGAGVSEELLPHLFEPFVSQKTQGTGLGLAIAKRIVEAHDGRIEAASASTGTVFRIYLPQALRPA